MAMIQVHSVLFFCSWAFIFSNPSIVTAINQGLEMCKFSVCVFWRKIPGNSCKMLAGSYTIGSFAQIIETAVTIV